MPSNGTHLVWSDPSLTRHSPTPTSPTLHQTDLSPPRLANQVHSQCWEIWNHLRSSTCITHHPSGVITKTGLSRAPLLSLDHPTHLGSGPCDLLLRRLQKCLVVSLPPASSLYMGPTQENKKKKIYLKHKLDSVRSLLKTL